MNKTVSIIIPVYNAEQYLDRCIQSILAQSYGDIEVLLINDGSTDNSKQICNDYADRDYRIKAVHQKNRGVSSARNHGIKLARGKYVTFVDGDDWLENGAIENMTNLMEEFRTDSVRTRCNIVAANSIKALSEDVASGKYEEKNLKHLQYVAATGGMHCYSWLLMIKADLLKRHKIIFPVGVSMMEDAWFYQDMLKQIDSIYISNCITYNYMVNYQGASRSTDGFLEKIGSILRVNQYITNFDFHEDQKCHINAVHISIITSMLMVRADRASSKEIREMLHIIVDSPKVKALYDDSHIAILTMYQRIASWAMVNNKLSIIICLKLARIIIRRLS